MQYVAYENLFAFSLVISGIFGWALSFLEHKTLDKYPMGVYNLHEISVIGRFTI